MNQNDITNISVVKKMKPVVHTYTTRWTLKEYDDLRRISEVQKIPISRILRMALLYYYAANHELDAFENVGDVAKITKEKIIEDLKIVRIK